MLADEGADLSKEMVIGGLGKKPRCYLSSKTETVLVTRGLGDQNWNNSRRANKIEKLKNKRAISGLTEFDFFGNGPTLMDIVFVFYDHFAIKGTMHTQ